MELEDSDSDRISIDSGVSDADNADGYEADGYRDLVDSMPRPQSQGNLSFTIKVNIICINCLMLNTHGYMD